MSTAVTEPHTLDNVSGRWMIFCQDGLALKTESQNHRIVGVGRDLCGSSSPTPLPKQGHLHRQLTLSECQVF